MADRRGVTILEMVVVMVILAMMMALAAALIQGASKDLSVPATVTHIESLARSTQTAARQQQSPAWLLFRTKERQVAVLVPEPLWNWHFEDLQGGGTESVGAFEQKANLKSFGSGRAFGVVDGRIGQGILMRADGWIEFPKIPLYAPDQGIAIEFWIYRDDNNSNQTLLSKGNDLSLKLVRARFEFRTCTRCGRRMPLRDLQCPLCGERMPPAARGTTDSAVVLQATLGKITANTYDMVPAFRWVNIACVFAGGELRLYVDGVLLAARKGEYTWESPGRLVFGARQDGFRGIVDEFSVRMVTRRETYPLPKDVNLEFLGRDKPDKNGDFYLHYDKEGRLHDARHRGPIDLKITGPEKVEARLRFELNGTMKESEPPKPPPKAPTAPSGGTQ